MVKNPPASAGDIRDTGLIPGLGGSPEAGNGNPLQYSCLENLMDSGAWWATVYTHTHKMIPKFKPYIGLAKKFEFSISSYRKT